MLNKSKYTTKYTILAVFVQIYTQSERTDFWDNKQAWLQNGLENVLAETFHQNYILIQIKWVVLSDYNQNIKSTISTFLTADYKDLWLAWLKIHNDHVYISFCSCDSYHDLKCPNIRW